MNTRNERLRRLLHEADPAAADPGLTQEESRALRRTVLTAVPEPRRRWSASPILAGAALMALLVVLAWRLWPGPGAPTAAPKTLPQVAVAAPQQVPVFIPGSVAPGVKVSQVPQQPFRRRPARRRSAPATTVLAASPIQPEVAAETNTTQQIQFSTPGGTRIIWVLTADHATE